MTGTRRIAPRSAADEVIRQLRQRADPERAASSQRYLTRTTVRYAIEHFPAGERKRLLQETR